VFTAWYGLGLQLDGYSFVLKGLTYEIILHLFAIFVLRCKVTPHV